MYVSVLVDEGERKRRYSRGVWAFRRRRVKSAEEEDLIIIRKKG